MVKDSAAHCNAVFSLSIVIASGYFGYMGYHPFYLDVHGLHMVAFDFVGFVGCDCLECSCWGGCSVGCWTRHPHPTNQTKSKGNHMQPKDT
jgi:hypothetical protein